MKKHTIADGDTVQVHLADHRVVEAVVQYRNADGAGLLVTRTDEAKDLIFVPWGSMFMLVKAQVEPAPFKLLDASGAFAQ